MNKPPDKIYLQLESSPEVTWCVDRINDTDPEYVLITRQRSAAIKTLIEQAKKQRQIFAIDSNLYLGGVISNRTIIANKAYEKITRAIQLLEKEI